MAGFLFEDEVDLALDRIVSKKMDAETAARAAKRLVDLFQSAPEINAETTEQPLRDLAKEMDLKAGHIFGLLREALTGQKVSPPIFDITEILGKEEVIQRVQHAADALEAQA
jgi:glutamyl-tRNA synthetase